MLPNALPNRPNLDRLKRLARALQRAANEGRAAERARIGALFPSQGDVRVKLSQAQLVIAREHGQTSWSALTEAVLAKRGEAPAPTKPDKPYLDPRALAEAWFTLAELGKVYPLMMTLQVSKRDKQSAFAVMRADPRFERFVDFIVTCLEHPDARMRFMAAHELDTFGSARTVAPLARLIDDSAPRVRWMAMHALTCHDCGQDSCTSDPAILARIGDRARSDENMKVRRHAAIALGFSRTPYAADVLRELIAIEPEPKFQNMARWALRYCETGKR